MADTKTAGDGQSGVPVNGGSPQTATANAAALEAASTRARLEPDDLITDHALETNDADRLRHLPIARELAELAIKAETPTNIALFGPWGSGKSSVLASVSRILKEIEPHTKTVRYDAWKYGGSALQRNFIFNAATELSFPDDSAHRDYYRGLYEKSRTADIRFRELLKSGWATIAKLVGLVVGAVAILWAVGASIALLTGHGDLVGQLTFQAVLALPWAVLLPAALGVLQTMLQGARVDFEQSAPSSDEQFSRTFRKLIEEALPARLFGGKHGRLVFLIDELDRCSPNDVAATLAALKTFLDERNCIFIVAIDREALEKALQVLPQAAPVDEENPYYSSASSFIDKVFQHQVTLPPLRTGRLTRLAAELVEGRGGLWAQIRSSAGGSQLTQLVLYGLIPSHVRSPRRVKILLNNFATAARMLEARGIDWIARAPELAKLVALRTEFPVFANDLLEEPRLPSLLLDRADAPNLSPRSRQLVARYAAAEPQRPQSSSGAAAQPLTPASQTSSQPRAVSLDPPIAKVDDSTAQVIARIQNQQLGRYLQRTAQIKDPGRDLLYVEAAGVLADIQDSALGQLIEDYAPDAPDDVVKQLDGRPISDQQKALLLLTDMADREVGFERSNCLRAILGVTDLLGDAIGEQADRVAETIGSFLLEQELPMQWLSSALRLACRAHARGRSLERALVDDPRLLADPRTLVEAGSLIDQLGDKSADAVRKRLVEEATANVDFAVEAFPRLSRNTVAAILKEISAPVQAALTSSEALGATKGNEFLDSFWDALDQVDGVDSQLRADFSWILLNTTSANAYDSVRAHADYLTDLAEPRRTRHALRAILRGPEADWQFWSTSVSAAPVPGIEDDQLLGAIDSMFSRTTWSDATASGASAAVLAKVAGAASPVDPVKIATGLSASIQSIAGARVWWLGSSERQAQTAIHRSIAALKSLEALSDDLDALALRQLVRALPPGAPITTETYPGLAEMGRLLSQEARLELVSRIQASVGQPQLPAPPNVQPLPTSTQPLATVAQVIAAGSVGLSTSDWGLNTADICAAARTGSDDGTRIAAAWLSLDPPRSDVALLAAAWVGRIAAIRDSLRAWLTRASPDERTRLCVELVRGTSTPDGWIRLAADVGIDEEAVATALLDELRGAKQFERRESLVDRLLELHPTTRGAQHRVAESVLFLLASGKKNDFELAGGLGPSLGDGHRLGAQMTGAFNSAIAAHGWTLSDTNRRSLEAAGVRPKRKRRLRDLILGSARERRDVNDSPTASDSDSEAAK